MRHFFRATCHHCIHDALQCRTIDDKARCSASGEYYAIMSRLKGSGTMGKTRSMRLPHSLDQWLLQRFQRAPASSSSEILVSLIHGGLRLREGYMLVHQRKFAELLRSHQLEAYATYRRCLLDTFGQEYVEHLDRWLQATDRSDIPHDEKTILR